MLRRPLAWLLFAAPLLGLGSCEARGDALPSAVDAAEVYSAIDRIESLQSKLGDTQVIIHELDVWNRGSLESANAMLREEAAAYLVELSTLREHPESVAARESLEELEFDLESLESRVGSHLDEARRASHPRLGTTDAEAAARRFKVTFVGDAEVVAWVHIYRTAGGEKSAEVRAITATLALAPARYTFKAYDKKGTLVSFRELELVKDEVINLRGSDPRKVSD